MEQKNPITIMLLLILTTSFFGTAITIQQTKASTEISFTKLTDYYIGGRAFDIKLNGDIAFVTDLYYGLHIINISDPRNPTTISNYNMAYQHSVYLTEEIAYVTNWNSGLEILEISGLFSTQKVNGYSITIVFIVVLTIYLHTFRKKRK